MKKSLAICFAILLFFSISLISANHRQDVQIVTSQQVTIPANDLIKLDIGGSYGWNLKNVKANREGDYRVYASFEFNNQKIEDSWEFKVSSLGHAPIELPVE